MSVMRWMNQADVVLQDVTTDTLEFYFFEGTDILGVSMCFSIKPGEPWESTIYYTDDMDLLQSIDDAMETGHYNIKRDRRVERLKEVS